MSVTDKIAKMVNETNSEAAERQASVGPRLDEIVGQSDAKKRLQALVDLHTRSGSPLGHLLLVGPSGCGKTTIARSLARELKAKIVEKEAQAIDKQFDLLNLIADLGDGDILLIRNIDRIRKALLDLLIQAMRSFELDVIVGKGVASRTMKLAIKHFACIATVSNQSDCPRQVADVFHTVLRLHPYQLAEMVEITARVLDRSHLSVQPETIEVVAKLAEDSPPKVESVVGRLASMGKASLTQQEADEILSAYGYIGKQEPRTLTADNSNLMGLSGVQFEHAIVELFEAMGFRADMTNATGDGGIDIEARLDQPIFGGLYIFQCKRFAPDSLVGSPTVREFYGALTARRNAIKGILITTSGFTAQAIEFAENLPIELIDGTRLQQLLSRYRSPENKDS
jgi:Holliday junction resolvasome RuvABC ATP-dependent DNA helicase subunit